jgi:hypothetical protein
LPGPEGFIALAPSRTLAAAALPAPLFLLARAPFLDADGDFFFAAVGDLRLPELLRRCVVAI